MKMRMEIAATARTLLHVSDAKIDGHRECLHSLIMAIANYLSMRDVVDDAMQIGLVSFSNPSFIQLMCFANAAPRDREGMIRLLMHCLSGREGIIASSQSALQISGDSC